MSNDFYVGYYEDHYFAHHGILGQKWGDKNGPPYPLDPGDHSAREKKSGWIKSLKTRHAEKKKKKQRQQALEKARVAKVEKAKQAQLAKEFEEKKQEVLRSGKASEILKYKGQMTNDEMQRAIARINFESQLHGLSQKEQMTGMQKIDKIMDNVGTITNWVNKAANAYDAVDRILKKVNGEEDKESILQKAIKSEDLEKINKYRKDMSFSQLAQALNKVNKGKELDEMLNASRAEKEAEEEKARQEAEARARAKAEERDRKKAEKEAKKAEKEAKKRSDAENSRSSSTNYSYDQFVKEGSSYVNSLLRGLPDNGGSKSSYSKGYDEDGSTVDLNDYFNKAKKASDAVDDANDTLLKRNADRLKGKKKKKK